MDIVYEFFIFLLCLTMYSDEANNYFGDDENPSITVVEESLTMKAGEKYMVSFCIFFLFLFQQVWFI